MRKDSRAIKSVFTAAVNVSIILEPFVREYLVVLAV